MNALPMVNRHRERAVLAGLLASLPSRGAAMVVLGAPGIGKSALLAEVSGTAADRGMLVLRTSGVQIEANLAFAGLHQLLRPVLAHLGSLPAPQRKALDAAFGTRDAPVPELFLIALATLHLLGEAAAEHPVLLIAEDAQWLDRPTADVLTFVARRVESDPIVALAAIRDGYASPLLAAGLPELRLEGLDHQWAADLLDARFPGLASDARRRLLAAAEGNPLALTELPAVLGGSSGARAAAMLEPLPLTKRLEQAFASRAADLPAVVRALLLTMAADDSRVPTPVMKAAGIISGAEPTVSHLVPAIEAHLIEATENTLGFRHPLVRSAIYQAASLAERHAAHAALAEALGHDPDRQAWHRAAATVGTDPGVAAALENAAWRAHRRGGIITAAAAFERAAGFTADPGRRGALLLAAAEAATELGEAEMAIRLLHEAGSCPLGSHERAHTMWLGEVFSEEPVRDTARVRLLVATAREVTASGDTRLALRLLSSAAFRCYWADLDESAADEILDAADQAGAAPDDPLLLQIQAYAAPLARGPAVLDHLERLASPDDPEELYLLGIAACLAGDFHRSSSLLGASAAALREQGRLRFLTHVLTARAWTSTMTSDFRIAIPAAEEASRLAAETAQPLWQAGVWTAQAALAALRGEQATVEDLATRVEQVMLPVGAAEPLSLVQYARGLLALGQGRHGDAYLQLSRIYDRGDPAHDRRNSAGAVGDLAEAAARSGHQDHARDVLRLLQPLREQTPWFRVAMRYADAMLAGDEEAEATFHDVLSLDLSAWPFMRARLQLAFGEWLRRRRRMADSRGPLRAARDAFDALGTIPWGERARRELRASGETGRRRPEAIDQLTPQELQIVELAAEGLTNREIGQRLYLSHRTIETHLYRVFPKIGITSRAQLKSVIDKAPRDAAVR
jgi:DNA-binding CsgD family transcriptional regulator